MFVIQNDLDADELRDLYTLSRRSARPAARVLRVLLWTAWFVYMLYALLLGLSGGSGLSVILLGLTGAMIWMLATRKKRYAAQMLKRKATPSMLTARVELTDEGIRLDDGYLHLLFRYEWVDALAHGFGIYTLRHGRELLALPERSFVEGDPLAAAAFLEQKTGKTIEEIR